ncbi:MAG: type II toxin-antitoxin system RelE/ParE family toxin [Bacteroidia bacterium]
MNPVEIIWTESALNDLNIIIEFISQSSTSLAEQVAYKILFRVNQLHKFPESGQIEPLLKNLKHQYRYLVVGHSKIIYRQDNSRIFIERIMDTRQNPIKLRVKNAKKKK